MKDKLFTKKTFPIILGLAALLIAMCAAFFSVFGISTLFAGAFISAIVMASSLEIGKLVGVTFLYRYWTKCKTFLKAYLVGASLVLMMITSLGIFGYLSAAYQKSSIEFSVTQEKIKNTENQKPYLQDKITAARKRIEDLTKLRSSQDNQINVVLTNDIIARNPLALKQLQQQTSDSIAATDKDIKDENVKIQSSIEDIQKLDEKINQMKLGTAEKKDVQTFKFVADALGVSLDKVARWFILSIIFVFDPLAICLILAYNVAVYRKEDASVYDAPPSPPVVAPAGNGSDEVKKMLSEIPKQQEPVPSPESPPQTPVVAAKEVSIEHPFKIEEAAKEETPVPNPDNQEKSESNIPHWFRSYFKL